MNIKVLNKFVKVRNDLDKQLQEVQDNREGLMITLSSTEEQVNQLKVNNQDMVNGILKMDVLKYISNNTELVKLESTLDKARDDVMTYDNLIESMTENIYNPLVEEFINSGVLVEEFNRNSLELRKELFKTLQKVEELSNELYQLEDTYRTEVNSIPHKKCQYVSFDVRASINRVLSRFGIKPMSKFKYTQHITTELYDFEK